MVATKKGKSKDGIGFLILVFLFIIDWVEEQGFIQTILMSGRRHKKTQFSNWVFKFNLRKILF